MSEITGKIKLIGETQTYGSNGFKKRDYVITTDETYPQNILIELHQDKIELIVPYKVGDNVKTSVNLRGREWVSPQGETKYFNSIVGWRIESVQNASDVPLPPKSEDAILVSQTEDDGLPF